MNQTIDLSISRLIDFKKFSGWNRTFRIRCICVAVATVFIVFSQVSVANAQTVRALVIGIDDYVELQDLGGAVNDARDIAAALSEVGVRDLVVLEDGQADRQTIEYEWNAILARAEIGDLVVLTYAGHGGQEPERVLGSENDGMDEVLLLGGFQSTGPGTRERIFDNELNHWFEMAGRKDVRVLFVADSCHSGTLTRAIDPRAPSPVVRTARYTITEDMLDFELPDSIAKIDEGELDHVSFLAAGQEYQQVPEFVLPGRTKNREPRGALSYMFARALEGKADINADGILRRDELWRFVRENVRMVSESRQTPNLLPNTQGHEVLLQWNLSKNRAGNSVDLQASQVLATDTTEARTCAIRIAVLNGESESAQLNSLLSDACFVGNDEFPDLIWDVSQKQVVTGLGDIVAYSVGIENLSNVVDKWVTVRAIRDLSEQSPLPLRVRPHDGMHKSGSLISVEIDGIYESGLTVIGLSGNGKVHYLYPLPSDPKQLPPGHVFNLDLKVTEPYGADHIVAFSALEANEELNAALARLDGLFASLDVARLLINAPTVVGKNWRIGLQGLFTAP